jgi:hypothetical protein
MVEKEINRFFVIIHAHGTKISKTDHARFVVVGIDSISQKSINSHLPFLSLILPFSVWQVKAFFCHN